MKADLTNKAVSLLYKYRNQIVFITAFSTIIIFIGQFLHNRHISYQREASLNYYNILESQNKNENNSKDLFINWIEENKNPSVFKVLASLSSAKKSDSKGNYTQAINTLKKATNNTTDPTLLSLINLRIAKLELKNNNADSAIAKLSNITIPELFYEKNIIHIDALVKKKEFTQALETINNTYLKLNTSQIEQSQQTNYIYKQLLNLKRNQINKTINLGKKLVNKKQ